MPKLVTRSILTLLFLFIVESVHAQAAPLDYPVTIPNVGSCESWEKCRRLCADPVNTRSCRAWAVENRLIRATPDEEQLMSLLPSATKELGCFTTAECKAYCTLFEHRDQCDQFAKNHGVSGGYDTRIRELVAQAANGTLSVSQRLAIEQEIKNLVPTPLSSNRTALDLIIACNQSSNVSGCTKVAEKLGIIGGEVSRGPGGCLSPTTCRKFCDNPANLSECRQYGYTGPAGCTSELSCYKACERGGCPETSGAPIATVDPQNLRAVETVKALATSCEELFQAKQGRPLRELMGTLLQGSCQVMDSNAGTACSDYIRSHITSPISIDPSEFRSVCTVTPRVIVGREKTQTVQEFSIGCSLYEKLGVGSTPYQVLAKQCRTIAERVQTARQYCNFSQLQRIQYFGSETEYRRYCLSAPSHLSDYNEYCQNNLVACRTGGYEGYCKVNPEKCRPLFEGKPLNVINAIRAMNALNAVRTSNPPPPPPTGQPTKAAQPQPEIPPSTEWDIVTPTPMRPFIVASPTPVIDLGGKATNTGLTPTPDISLPTGTPPPALPTPTSPTTNLTPTQSVTPPSPTPTPQSNPSTSTLPPKSPTVTPTSPPTPTPTPQVQGATSNRSLLQMILDILR